MSLGGIPALRSRAIIGFHGANKSGLSCRGVAGRLPFWGVADLPFAAVTGLSCGVTALCVFAALCGVSAIPRAPDVLGSNVPTPSTIGWSMVFPSTAMASFRVVLSSSVMTEAGRFILFVQLKQSDTRGVGLSLFSSMSFATILVNSSSVEL